MNLLSFLWLWKIAAWSMGLSSLAYLLLGMSGFWLHKRRSQGKPHPGWLRPFHYLTGITMVILVLVLLTIGLVGTIGYYGSLGHSAHLLVGFGLVILVLISATTATQIGKYPQARSLHVGTNVMLFLAFISVSITGWNVLQKYLP